METRPLSPAVLVPALVTHLKSEAHLTELQRQELPAAISHWLQSQDQVPPLLDARLRAYAVEYGIALATTSKAPSGERATAEPVGYAQVPLPLDWTEVPYPPPSDCAFKFIDLFAGIGGFRIAFQRAGGKCVFSSEWDKYAKLTYSANFGEVPYGDIRLIPKAEIPDHDVLCAGFPCQPFSLAGVSKKNALGRQHGFLDETQGTLFFEIKEILRVKRPRAFMLENVKNLLSHDHGNTFRVIHDALEKDLGYVVKWKIVDGARWVPQHRERIFIVGFDPGQSSVRAEDIEIPDSPTEGYIYPELSTIVRETVDGYTVGPGTWDTLLRHKAHHASVGNGFGYGLHELPIAPREVTRTISARYHKDGAEILIGQPGRRPRRLTVTEAMQLQGFDPDRFVFPVSNTQAYRQIGNSVVVPAVAACAQAIAEVLGR